MKVVTGKVRASYVNVFAPRHSTLSGKTEYSMAILIDKNDQATLSQVETAVKSAADKKWPGKKPANMRHPLRDGDDEGKYPGCFFLNVKSSEDRKPGVVDRNLQPVLDSAEFISGDYCRVSLNSFAYDQAGNRGVSFALNNVQVLEKGEPLTSRARPEDDFEVWQGSPDESEWG